MVGTMANGVQRSRFYKVIETPTGFELNLSAVAAAATTTTSRN